MRVVYLHGFASAPTSSKARFFREKFAKAGVDTVVPALDGGDFRNMTLSSQLTVIEAAIGDVPAVMMGSSLGGYLAAVFAARHPVKVERVILLAPAFRFARLFPADFPGVTEWKRTGVTEIFHYGQGRKRELAYGLIEDALKYEDYPDVGQPTLLLHGALDPVVPVSVSREFARRHPASARLCVYPKSGHELTDVTAGMWSEVAAFLDLKQ